MMPMSLGWAWMQPAGRFDQTRKRETRENTKNQGEREERGRDDQTFAVGHVHRGIPVGPESGVEKDAVADRSRVGHEELGVSWRIWIVSVSILNDARRERGQEREDGSPLRPTTARLMGKGPYVVALGSGLLRSHSFCIEAPEISKRNTIEGRDHRKERQTMSPVGVAPFEEN